MAQTRRLCFDPAPIDLGPEGDIVFLALYGTGFRNRSALSAVKVQIGGTEMTINYAGPQLQLVGLDQINVFLPRSLAGRGETDVVVTVDGKAANTVKVNFKQAVVDRSQGGIICHLSFHYYEK